MAQHPSDRDARRISRRRFLALSGSSVSALALAAACGPQSGVTATPTAAASASSSGSAIPDYAKDPVELTFFHYAGSNQDVVPTDVAKQYMTENPNVKINLMAGSNLATMPGIIASIKTTGKPSVNAGYFNAAAVALGDVNGIWTALDPAIIPNLKDIPDVYQRPGGKGVTWGVSALGIAYRKDKVTPAPTSWLDLLSPRFKGRVALTDGSLAITGLYAINRIMGGSERNIDPGIKAFGDAAKAGQFAFIAQNTGSIFTDGALANTFDIWGEARTKLYALEVGGAPLAFAVPKEGVVVQPLGFQILQGNTPAQAYHAAKIINQLLAPANLSRYLDLTLTAATSTKVTLPDKLKNDPSFAADVLKNAIQLDWVASAENATSDLDKWNQQVKAVLK